MFFAFNNLLFAKHHEKANLAFSSVGKLSSAVALTIPSIQNPLYNFTLKSASFQIKDFYQGSGHKHYFKKNQTLSLEMGNFIFEIDAHDQQKTAFWFNKHLSAKENTFNQEAKLLDFAIMGDLSLDIEGETLDYSNAPYTFKNIVLAKGVNESWWFGGSKTCQHKTGFEVLCKGTDKKGKAAYFIFTRGENASNQVLVRPYDVIGTTEWMKRLSDKSMLNEVMMPGSNEAGISELRKCTVSNAIGYLLKTQGLNIKEQLEAGARYFDLHVDIDNNELITYHKAGKLACSGQSVEAVLKQAKDFLKKHTSETFLLKFSYFASNAKHEALIQQKVNALLLDKRFSKFLYKSKNKKVNLSKLSLKDVRGKMITLFSYAPKSSTTKGQFRYRDGLSLTSKPCAYAGENLTVCDKYSNTTFYNQMEKEQLELWHKYAGVNKDYLFLLSWTLTSKGASIETLSKVAHSALPEVLYEQIVLNKKPLPNIVYLDFINKEVTQSIIQYNFRKKL